MARTFKTRPTRVKAHDKPTYLIPWHDHRSGPCDLPAEKDWQRRAGTACTWELSQEFWSHNANNCGCSMCTAKFERRQDRRRDRHAARRYATRRWLDEY